MPPPQKKKQQRHDTPKLIGSQLTIPYMTAMPVAHTPMIPRKSSTLLEDPSPILTMVTESIIAVPC